MAKKILFPKGLLAFMTAFLCSTHAVAWDTKPDPETGKYDKYFDRPTHFPDWSQPTEWPNNMAYTLAVKVGKSDERLENYEVAVYDQNDKLRCCGRSYPNQNHLCSLTIMGTEGDTFRFEVIYGDDFANPTIEPIPELTVPFKTNFVTGNKSNPYWLTLPVPTVLNEKSTDPIVAETNANVRVIRTINANEWGTICLPFAMTEEQIAEAFPDNTVLLGDFTGCVPTLEDDGKTIKSIQVNFDLVTEMEANHPYIIKLNKGVTEFKVSGVDIIALENTNNASVARDPYAYQQQVEVGWNEYEYVTRYRYNYFVGNYVNDYTIPNKALFLSGGNFWYSVGKTKMMGLRGFFSFYYTLPDLNASHARIAISITDETEGITSVSREPCFSSSVYTLDGRNVGHELNLRKGIYIIGGKKQVIK